MRPIAPRLGDQFDEITVAEDQPEYMTVVAARVVYSDRSVDMFLRWTFTPEERARIAAGEDIYLSFPRQVAPHRLQLRPEWAA